MKKIRCVIALFALLTGIGCIILLLNFTASNPTGRRYSSEMPVTTKHENTIIMGYDAERILSNDLDLPRNDSPEQLQCICSEDFRIPSDRSPTGCRSCFAYGYIRNYRRPDFVGEDFIAESKNQQGILYNRRDFEQIADYVTTAKAAKMKLWVYVRVDTEVDEQYYDLVESTGGGIVPYFTVSGYKDSTSERARQGLIASLGILVVIGAVEYRQKTTPDRSEVTSGKKGTLTKAARSTSEVEDFVVQSKEAAQKIIDKYTDD